MLFVSMGYVTVVVVVVLIDLAQYSEGTRVAASEPPWPAQRSS